MELTYRELTDLFECAYINSQNPEAGTDKKARFAALCARLVDEIRALDEMS